MEIEFLCKIVSILRLNAAATDKAIDLSTDQIGGKTVSTGIVTIAVHCGAPIAGRERILWAATGPAAQANRKAEAMRVAPYRRRPQSPPLCGQQNVG
jgi:hypothetical protein